MPRDSAAGTARAESPLGIRLFAWTGGAIFVTALAGFAYTYLGRFGRPAPPGTWLGPAAVNIGLFTVFALHHSVFARTGLRQWIRGATGPRLERAVYVWIASLLFLGVCWLWRPVPGELYRLEGAAALPVRLLQAAGLVLTILGARALDVLELAGIRQAERRPREVPTPLVTSGVFALVRHPLYLGWALLVFGTAHMTMSRATFAVVSTLYLMVAIPWEERGLVETFGPAYEDYQRRVRWRMLPYLY